MKDLAGLFNSHVQWLEFVCQVVRYDNNLAKIASRGYHEYRNSTWRNAKAAESKSRKVEKETSATSKSIDTYACAIKIKNRYFENWITVGHIPREISRHCYFFIKEGGQISGHLVSTNYKPSPIPAGGLEVPLLLTFSVNNENIFNQMKEFASTLYSMQGWKKVNAKTRAVTMKI